MVVWLETKRGRKDGIDRLTLWLIQRKLQLGEAVGQAASLFFR